ncbi:unnamed protein product [Urochloa humidicola]
MPCRRRPPTSSWSPPFPGPRYPLVALGRRLASKGLLVTLTTVPNAGLKLRHHHHDGSSINIQFEHLHGGDIWAQDEPRYRDPDEVALHLTDVATTALIGLIRRQTTIGQSVTYGVANLFVPWLFATIAPRASR